MDPRGSEMMNEEGGGGGAYNFSEIWPGFQMNVNAASYGSVGLDPMAVDERSNRTPPHTSRKRRDEDDSTKGVASTSNASGFKNTTNNSNKRSDSKRMKAVGSDDNQPNKIQEEGNMGKAAEQPAKMEPPKQDYIHVRARRGQATDSHSLAERARREKISERMRILQDLVPGCNKIIGKALVLDEIINYIQSLQHQVEFLSMKLEAVNARGDIDGYQPKEFAQQSFEPQNMSLGSQGAREHDGRGSSPEWLHMQIGSGGSFERTS